MGTRKCFRIGIIKTVPVRYTLLSIGIKGVCDSQNKPVYISINEWYRRLTHSSLVDSEGINIVDSIHNRF